MKMIPFSVSFLTIVIIATSAHAQSQYLRPALNQSINMAIDERALAGLSLSCSKEFRDAFGGKGVYIRGGIEIPAMLIVSAHEFNDFNLFAESGTRLFHDTRAGVGTAVRVFLDRQSDVLGRRTAWGFQLKALPFLRFNTFLVGVDLAWHQVLGMYINHITYTRETFRDRYPSNNGPEDGWYLSPATVFKTGLACGGIVRHKFTLDFSAGLKLVPSRFHIFMNGMMFGQIPFYAAIGFGAGL